MPNKDLGTKRICPSCGAKFYDMHKSPIECLKCEFIFVPEAPKRPTRVTTPAAAAPEAKKDSDEILAKAKESNGDDDVASAAGIDVDVDDDDDEQDKGVLEDAPDLMGGDDDVPAVPGKAGGGSPEDR